MSSRKTLSSVWSEYATTGIFQSLNSLQDHATRFPWISSQEEAAALDALYYTNQSGRKLISYLVEGSINSNGVLTTEGKAMLARVVAFKYERNWKRLWNTMIAEYSPTQNYNVTTTRELSKSDTEDETVNKDVTDDTDVTHGMVQTTSHGKTENTDEYTYGFNSVAGTPVPSGKTTIADGGTDTTTDSGTDSTGRVLNDDTTRSKEGSGSESEEVHKSGVIGTVSIQKLLSEERDVWVWNFLDQVFSDIDKILAIAVYDGCR